MPQQRAVIYCRISDRGQTGLGSQNHRCMQYAAAKEYEVVKTFSDEITGGGDFMKRKGMVALLKFLDKHPEESFVVIFDDLKRYSRDVEFHHKLRREMNARNAIRECLNFNFENSPEGTLKETITVAAGQYERESNARQNRQKKIARLEQGYAIYAHPPAGYKFVKEPGGSSKILVLDEPVASAVRDALESYAANRLTTQAEVLRFLEQDPRFPQDKIRAKRVNDMLKQPLYAGYVHSKELGVSLREGKHTPLISKTTFEKIQRRLKEKSHAPARKDLDRGFVLRGAVACSCCGKPLKSSWSTGMTKRFPYYLCQTKGCDWYGKSIRRADIEGQFEELLKTIQPSEPLVKTTIAMFRLYWDKRVEQAKSHSRMLKSDIKDVEDQVQKLIHKIVKIDNDRVVKAMEEEIERLEKKKLILAEQAQNQSRPQPDFNSTLELSLNFLAKPWKIWELGDYDLRRIVLRLVISEPLLYDKNEGYRTPILSMPFSMLADNFGSFSDHLSNGAPRRRKFQHFIQRIIGLGRAIKAG